MSLSQEPKLEVGEASFVVSVNPEREISPFPFKTVAYILMYIFLILFTTCLAWFINKCLQLYFLVNATRVDLDWINEETCVGKTIICKIKITNDDGSSCEPEDLQDIIHHMEIDVCQKNKSIQISVLQESDKSELNVVKAKFSVRESGIYDIYVKYVNYYFCVFHFSGNPFSKEFQPGVIYPGKTRFVVHNPASICVQKELLYHLKIETKDFYGNFCRTKDFDVNLFSFVVNDQNTCSSNMYVEHSFILIVQDENPQDTEYPKMSQLYFKIKIHTPGIYVGSIFYSKIPIKDGKMFDIICITTEEEEILKSNFSSLWLVPSPEYDAKLLCQGSEQFEPKKEVRISVVSLFVFVTEFSWCLPYWKKLARYLVSRRSKIEFNGYCDDSNSDNKLSKLTISDGMQPPLSVVLSSRDARLVLVSFAHYQGNRTQAVSGFEEKKKIFQQDLSGVYCRFRGHLKSVDNVSRIDILESIKEMTSGFSSSDWLKVFDVQFQGESDDGKYCCLFSTLSKHKLHWMSLVCEEIFVNSPSGMFCSAPSSTLLHPNLASRRHSRFNDQYYTLVGKIVGKYLYEAAVCGETPECSPVIRARFTRSFLAQVLGIKVNYKHLEQDDPELYNLRIKKVLMEKDVESLQLNFTENEDPSPGWRFPFNSARINLIPNGSNEAVTKENKEKYLNVLTEYHQVYRYSKEISAFRTGFNQIIPPELLADFDENELELLLCGGHTFKIEDLKLNHEQGVSNLNMADEVRVFEWLWLTVSNMCEEETSRLLQLTTGSSILPPGGFKNLLPMFTVNLTGSFGQEPTALPSLHQICLSDHASFENFEEALLHVIHGGEDESYNPLNPQSSATGTSGTETKMYKCRIQ